MSSGQGKGQDGYVWTHALLDPGSNKSLCSIALVEKLGIEGSKTTLSLETLNAGQDSAALEVGLEVTSIKGKKKKQTCQWSVP